MEVRIADPTLRAALFLRDHPGWTPDDLDRADPDLVELMRAIDTAVAKAAKNRKG